MTAFTRDGSHIIWATSTGDLRLSEADAERWLDLLHQGHDAAMRADDRPSARTARKLILDLGEALKRPATEAWPVIPELRPITVQVRQLDPALWGDAA